MYEMDGILYAGELSKIIKVLGVNPLDGCRLLLTFSTGEKIYDMKHLLDLPVF